MRLCVCWFCSTPKQPNSFNKTVVYTHTLLSVILLQEKEPKKQPFIYFQLHVCGINPASMAQRERESETEEQTGLPNSFVLKI